MVMYMIFVFQLSIGVYISDQDSFGKEIVSKRNIDWLSGVRFITLRIKEGLGFMTLRSRIELNIHDSGNS
jgi:hypothetical protein